MSQNEIQYNIECILADFNQHGRAKVSMAETLSLFGLINNIPNERLPDELYMTMIMGVMKEESGLDGILIYRQGYKFEDAETSACLLGSSIQTVDIFRFFKNENTDRGSCVISTTPFTVNMLGQAFVSGCDMFIGAYPGKNLTPDVDYVDVKEPDYTYKFPKLSLTYIR